MNPKNVTTIVNIVNKEVEHIPRGFEGSAQRDFRLFYRQVRFWNLVRDSATPRSVTLARTVTLVHEHHPDFEPNLLDPEYFESGE